MFTRTVDVLTADLTTVEVDESILSARELGRALEYAMTSDLRPYLAARTWLRHRLAEYLECPAEEIEFAAEGSGSSRVVAPATDLTFDLSFAGDMVVLAIGFRVPVGVAVESSGGSPIRPEQVRHVLIRPEADAVFASPDLRREFLRLWSRRQALASALGGDVGDRNVMGLSPVVVDGFELTDVNLGDGMHAAVAVREGCSLQVTLVDVAAESAPKVAVAV